MVLHHIWDSGYQHCHRSYSSKSLAWDSIQFSVMLSGYVQFVAVFVLLYLVELYLVACCLRSTEYGPCVGGIFQPVPSLGFVFRQDFCSEHMISQYRQICFLLTRL